MKAFVKEFVKRGCLFCGGGPLILAVIYLFLAAGGTVQSVPVGKLVTEILTSLLLAFIAAGISAVHTVDRLQLPNALLIHGAVLFADYLGIYLLNGWLPLSWAAVGVFAASFVAVFLLISLIIYKTVQAQIKKLNGQIQ